MPEPSTFEDRGDAGAAAVRVPHAPLATASVLFVLSGAASLAYEVIWAKRLALMWGSSSAAIAAVVAAFLGGLGVGAYLFGRRADRVAYPLRAYAFCELVVGLVALAVPSLIGALEGVAPRIYELGDAHPLVLACARFAITFVLLAPATLLMGATFPLLVRQFSASGGAGRATSWLYFLNGLGAATGALTAGFYLLPSWGMERSNGIVVTLTLVVAAIAWVTGRHARVEVSSAVGFEARSGSKRGTWAILAASALTGCAALLLQMTWTRQAVLITGGSTYAFSAILGVFILSVSGGSLLFYSLPSASRSSARTLSVVVVVIVVSVLVGQALRPDLTRTVAALAELRVSGAYNALVCVMVALVIAGPPTFFNGFLFPLLVQLLKPKEGSAGDAAGGVYGWNTVGSVLGVTVAAALLFPLLGTFWLAVVAACFYPLALFVLASLTSQRSLVQAFAGSALALALVGGVALAPSPATTKLLNSGAYIYGNQLLEYLDKQSTLLFHKEGTAANVIVFGSRGAPGEAEQHVSIRTNGKVDGSTSISDMQTQVGGAYLPRILRPDADDMCVIGFGTGTTAGAALLLPGTRVTCCEIERAMIEASPYFAEVNHSPERSPNFTAVIDDGRNYLQASGEEFDLVISVPSNPWIAGVGSLYTERFYRTIQSRLTPGGLLGQWIQAYQLSAGDYARVLATARHVFPHVAVLRFNEADTMVLASEDPIVPEDAVLDAAQSLLQRRSAVTADLYSYLGTEDVRALLVRYLLLDEAGVARLVDEHWDGVLNTDANLRIEYDAPKELFAPRDWPGSARAALYAAASPELPVRLAAGWHWRGGLSEILIELRAQFARHEQLDYLRALAEQVVESHPNPPPAFLHDAALYAQDPSPREWMATVERLVAADPMTAQALGASLGQSDQAGRAALVYEILAREFPSSAPTLAKWGTALWQLGLGEDARELAERAAAIDPASEAVVLLRGLIESGR